ncbi:hypothetical protein EMN47_16515 [Prolixibacteraceae bacterium JC049]|nr:hypothetical protein [Prolixibacteraceae bacterium JC049]
MQLEKICPNCGETVEESFQLCWNCTYSFTEEKVVEIKDLGVKTKEIDCLRCQIPMKYVGEYRFHEGPDMGVMGPLFAVFQNREAFDLYLCPRCGKVEFFAPMDNSEYKNS